MCGHANIGRLDRVGQDRNAASMVSIEPDRSALRRALECESQRVARLALRAEPLSGPVPGLQWTKAQLIAHLCAICAAFGATLRGEDFVERFGARFVGRFGSGPTLPEAVAATNARVLKDASFPGAAKAAEALGAGAATLLKSFDTNDDLRVRRPAPWYGPELTLPGDSLLALAVCEFLTHGHDLARAVGADPRPSARTLASGAAVAAAMMSQMLPLVLDQRAASGFDGCFEIRIRGGQRFLLHIRDGKAWSAPADNRDGHAGADPGADCLLSLSGYHAMLIGYGRLPVWRAIATGKAFAFGRRPWLGLRFPRLFLTP
jgi:hypothetical protein